jgi:DNA-directed RNA polymerase subunit beta
MQSLGLNVEVLDAAGNTVSLVDEEFEADRAAEDLGINLSRNEALSADNDYPTYN